MRHPEYNQPDRLFVIIDESVFSSALLNAFQMRQKTRATFVGAEAGDWVDHFGEVETFKSPYHQLTVWYSTQRFLVDEQKNLHLIPDLLITTSSQQFFDQGDPLVEAVFPFKRRSDILERPQLMKITMDKIVSHSSTLLRSPHGPRKNLNFQRRVRRSARRGGTFRF